MNIVIKKLKQATEHPKGRRGVSSLSSMETTTGIQSKNFNDRKMSFYLVWRWKLWKTDMTSFTAREQNQFEFLENICRDRRSAEKSSHKGEGYFREMPKLRISCRMWSVTKKLQNRGEQWPLQFISALLQLPWKIFLDYKCQYVRIVTDMETEKCVISVHCKKKTKHKLCINIYE